jgi:Secretion system C-terminal sorting domain/Calx-beta domain
MKTNYKLNRNIPIFFWKSLSAIIILLFCQNSIAQTVTIPAANTNLSSNNQPLGAFFGYQRTAMIYTAAELGLNSGAVIKSLYFYYNSYQTPNSNTPAIVRISNTTETTFNSSTFASEIVGATEVANSGTMIPTSLPATGGWVGFVFNAPFFFTGNNIKITIETNAGGFGAEADLAKQYRWSSGASESWRQDNLAPTGLGTVNNTRPNIQFGFGFSPANDACSGALVANAYPYTHMQTMAENATNNDGFLGCVNAMNDGVWYKFTGTGGNMKIDLTDVFYTFDPQLDIYIGVCGNLDCIASADLGNSGGNETLTIPTTLGTTYFVNVGHWQDNVDAPEGNFNIRISDLTPNEIAYDYSNFYGYENQTATIKVNRISGTNGVVSVDYLPNDGNAYNGLDYTFTGGTLTWAEGDITPKTFQVQLLPDAVIDPLETFTFLLLNPTNSTIEYGNSASVTIIDANAVPANDACVNALNAVALPYSHVQTLGESATNNSGFLNCFLSGMNDGIWYKFTGNGSNITTTISNVANYFNPQLSIYTGGCGASLNCLDYADNGSASEGESLTIPSILGTVYYVAVGDYRGGYDAPEGNFKIDITTTALSNESFDIQNLKVYPNPVTDILNIESSSTISKISMVNLLGQEVKSINNPANAIDVSELESGVYLLKMTSDAGSKIVKITKK